MTKTATTAATTKAATTTTACSFLHHGCTCFFYYVRAYVRACLCVCVYYWSFDFLSIVVGVLDQPDDFEGSEDCLLLYYVTGELNDMRCSYTGVEGYICETDSMC